MSRLMLCRLVCLSILFLVFGLVFSCACGDGDSDDDQPDDDDDDDRGPRCPDDAIALGKSFLADGNGDAAHAVFAPIPDAYPECTEAYFGVVLADQLRFIAIVDDMLSLILDSVEEKGPIDVGAIVVDYVENLLEPIILEMLDHLERCREDAQFSFELESLPLSILDLQILGYAGEYDSGDVLLQSAEFTMIAAALNTILSADLSFDFQIVMNHFPQWEEMDVISIIIDVIDMIFEILDDSQYPDFLRLREQGYTRMPLAGLQMGHTFDFFNQGIDWLRAEPQDPVHDVTGCADRNKNGLCDPNEFMHGVFYSLPSDLHWEMQAIELSIRDSYWDRTDMDTEPGIPNAFDLGQLNAILLYFGLPPLVPSTSIDFGAMYTDPDPEGIREPLRKILILVRTILDLFFEKEGAFIGEGEGSVDSNRGSKTIETGSVPQGPPAVGLATATDIAALPYLNPRARTLQFSSHDPTGGNEDGYSPPNHLYIDEHGEFVIFDQFGPGCIYRMWFTNTWSLIGNFRIYVDDMETPVLEGPYLMLVLSLFQPFSSPLVYNYVTSSGGCVSYLPIPFTKRCKITDNIPREYFNVTYVKYDADTPVTSYTGTEDDSLLRWQFNHTGEDPKPQVPSHTESGSIHAAPDSTETLAGIQGAGAIWKLYLDPAPLAQDAVEGLWIKAYWDDEETPSVQARANEFFGNWYIDEAPRSLLLGHDGERFYCYFPMPFQSRARIEIENQGEAPVDIAYEIQVADQSYGPGYGYFKAIANEQDPVPVDRDYRIGLRQDAYGKFVGVTHTMRGPTSRWYLEGDERFYVDGSASPALYGTGTEDYYNGGWYFLVGPFDRPLWGNPSKRSFPGYSMTGCYRLHVGDAVHYMDGVRLGIEHGGSNSNDTDRYSSVAYYYESPGAMLTLTDVLEIGDAGSEATHGYQATDAVGSGELTSYYEGDDDRVPLTDSGRIVQTESSFFISVDAQNDGVVLRRRYDQAEPRQQAAVLVDGSQAGIWYTPESSEHLRWAEDDFVLPPSLTQGKTSIQVTIRVQGEVPWTEFAYWVFSIGK